MSAEFDAEALTLELAGRWAGRYGIVRCPAPSHVGDDLNPSCHIANGRNGWPICICRSQRCPDIIEGLRARGLWPARGPSPYRTPRRPRRLTLAEQIALEPAPAPPLECCLNREVQCEHWLDFDRQVLLANLRGNLACAVREIVDLFARAREPLSSDELVAELRFAIGFGEIAPTEIPDFVVDLAIAEAIDPYLSGAIDHAAQ